MSSTSLLTPSPESLRAIALEALRRAAEAQGLPPESVTLDAITGLAGLMLVAACIEAKAAASAGNVDSAA